MRAVCVYCGSRSGHDERFAHAARELAQALVAQGLTLVYGGGKVGLMGIIADQVMRLGGHVVGVIPEDLQRREVGHNGISTLHVVPSMHARKQMMVDLADAFIALPGSIGTFEELFETFTWLQLGYHAKPIGLLNVAGYYDPLLAMLDKVVENDFLSAETARSLHVDTQTTSLLNTLRQHAHADAAWPLQRARI